MQELQAPVIDHRHAAFIQRHRYIPPLARGFIIDLGTIQIREDPIASSASPAANQLRHVNTARRTTYRMSTTWNPPGITPTNGLPTRTTRGTLLAIDPRDITPTTRSTGRPAVWFVADKMLNPVDKKRKHSTSA